MTTSQADPVAVVGLAAIMPQAPTAETFWTNLKKGVYSITDVPPERWDPAVYYDPDHSAVDKTYSRIGGWVREFEWNPIAWRLPIPPKVAEQMDQGQRWAVSAARAALTDAGYPEWKVDGDRVAVIIGNAIGGEKHYQSSMRIRLPEMLRRLQESPTLRGLAPDVQQRIVEETRDLYRENVFDITEDTMPGELSNVMAGRVANLFNLRGPNFTTDAACASALAAIDNAVMGLREHRFDAAVCGGVDRNMGVEAFVKFCKIGALSATGTRPFDAGADGFVMGEGAAVFVLKRLEDAERDGDRIYATIVGIAGSSDGKGKGITAPNPVGQQLAVRRAWADAGEDMGTVSSIEAHGTSTRVGDAAELTSLSEVFGSAGLPPRSVALGSVKSNIGHLKAAAGAAGLFKMVRSLHERVLVPSLSFRDPNPGVDWDTSAFAVTTALREWPEPPGGIRRGGVSAFGFGGTNYHVVVEEHVPGRHRPRPRVHASAQVPRATVGSGSYGDAANSPDTPPAQPIILDVRRSSTAKAPLRGALVLGAGDDAEMVRRLTAVRDAARTGQAPSPAAPDRSMGQAAVRVAVDFGSAEELVGKLDKVIMGLQTANPAVLKMMRQQGAFVGRGPAPKVAFLYTGQGSQYVNMLRGLAAAEPVVGETFAEADRVMTPLLGRPLTDYIFVDPADEAAVAAAGRRLMQTEITQPAVLATDLALTRLLAAYGIAPDMVMGHSLGEYGALVAAGALSFEGSLEAVSARGREMAHLSVEDNGAMAAVFGPLETIQRMVDDADGYAVVANINSYSQAVVGGATDAVERLIERFTEAGLTASRIPVSHAFHTSIVAPASVPFGEALRRLDVRPPTLPIVANVTGDFYPSDATTETMLDYARRQIASPVQFVKGLETLYAAGARVFVEVGPKKALHGFVEDVLASRHDDVVTLFTNHPKVADEVGVNQALCGLWAAGVGFAGSAVGSPPPATPSARPAGPITLPEAAVSDETITELGRLFAGVLEEGMRLYRGETGTAGSGGESTVAAQGASAAGVAGRTSQPAPATGVPRPGAGLATTAPVVITGAALGLPGVERTFDDENVARILAGQSFIESLPQDVRDRMVDMRITRVVKDAVTGSGSFVTIDDPADVIKLAARHAPLDMVGQFGIDRARDEALDNTTRLAVGAGFDALRDAGIPLTLRYKTTTIGSQLPDTWGLPEALRDDTGVIFASAFPGYDRFAEAIEEYALDRGRRENLAALTAVRERMADGASGVDEVDRLIAELTADIEANPYHFDRRFLFRALAMGHSQFAEIIGARGPNTQVNAACASTTQALSVAEDWIRSGRAKRVIVVSADDATAPHLLPWVTAGFLATGAAATDERVEDAATPFDRRRHGMIVGMGAAAFVVESAESARERGLSPIAEVLAAVTANSAFHGTRLDVEHIGGVMESLIVQAERRGVKRHEIAPQTMFMSHETYTPARGGSAAAEINALRRVFGEHAGKVVITNTKGFTGHAMGAGIEDVVAIKALETGLVPPVPNYKEPDPDLGVLNLSTGGRYEVEYALRLAAGFGSQIAMALLRRTPLPGGARRAPDGLGYAYRIVDRHAWQHWLDGLSGHEGSTLEVDHRRLRVTDVGAPAVPVTPVTHVPVPYPGIAGSVPAVRGSSPIAPTIDYPKPFDHAAGAKATSSAAPPPASPAPAASAATPAKSAPAQAPVSEPAATAPPVPEPSGDAVLAKVTAIVSEMTGYPADLLDPDLDLEADLGVDTVKQAEVFAAVREEYGVERDATLQLRDFPTLHHVAGWIRDKAGIAAPTTTAPTSTAPTSAATTEAAPASAGPAAGDAVLAKVTAIVSEMTGYPADLLDPDLDLEADLGVDTVKQAEVFAAVREEYGVERDATLQLRDFPTLHHVAGWIRDKAGIAAPTTTAPTSTAPTSAATTEAAPASAGPAAGDAVLAKVTAIVSEMTGYPADLLDPDLDLEADLGVDTVKQAEVFAAVREEYGVERDATLQLRDFPTLHHVAGWIRDKAGIAAPTTEAPAASAAAAQPTAPAAQTVSGDAVLAKVTEIVAEMTGYPADLLDPDLDLEADLGVDTVKQAEVFAAVREEYGVERDATLQLRDFPTLHHVAGWIRDKAGIAAPTTEAPAASAAAAQPTAPAAQTVSGDAVLAKVTEIVAEMTGYPADLLDPDLDLEADLGVDTVKQAEVFAAVREEYGVERDATLQLRDFPTLHHVATWVRDKADMADATGVVASPAGAEGAPVGGPTHTAAAPHAPTMAMVEGDLAAIDTLPRRVPVPSLRPAADDCVETGVALEGARIVVMLDEGGVGRSLVGRLEQAGATALTLEPGVSTEDLSTALDDWLADGPVAGVYWLPALDAEGEHAELDLEAWTEALRRRVKALYTTMRRLWDDSPFLVAATRLGGYHGYDGAGATNPMGGAVTGFTKSYKKERPDALVKAVDFPASRKTAALADLLVEETLRDPGAVEVGRTDDRRWGVSFTERPFPPLGEDGSSHGAGGMSLGPDSVVVVTGAAGSIVSAITADLAAASGGTFHLLDLTPEPDRDDPDLAAFAADREGLKATLAARMKAAGERPTPVAIEKEIARLERLASAAAAIDAVESAGGTAHYHCVDLTDAEAVTAVAERIAEASGAVDVLLHAAGLEISRNLPEKEAREFDLVFDVKTTGWFTLWHALRHLEVGATVVFSSVAGRFGNQGQTDYAAANDLLCKITSAMRRTRPETRALALDWTAWGGIGMATRGSIPRIMELAGVQMLPPEAGVAWIRRELTSSDHSGEVIVAGTLGMMAAEYAESGGLDAARLLGDRARGPMVGEVSASVHQGIVVTTTLDPREQPFLDDHRIDGTAVLPGVMGMEAFAEAAGLAAPSGYRVAAVEDVGFHAPVKFYRDEPRTVTVTALTHPDPAGGEDLLVECALTAERHLPGQDAPTVTTHFTGRVRLSTGAADEESVAPVGGPAGRELAPEEVYRLYFHGPAYQVVGAAWAADGAAVARLAQDLPENHSPADAPLVGAPRLAELGFQAAGLWEAGRDGRLALPHRVGSLRVASATVDGPVYAVARQSGESTFDIRVVDGDGRVLVHLSDYVSIPLPSPIDPEVGTPLAEVFGA